LTAVSLRFAGLCWMLLIIDMAVAKAFAARPDGVSWFGVSWTTRWCGHAFSRLCGDVSRAQALK
jgi:hypothetical protein